MRILANLLKIMALDAALIFLMRVYISSLLCNGALSYGGQWLIHCKPSTVIALLKAKVAQELQLEAHQLCLSCDHTVLLSEDRTLASYGLTSDPCYLRLQVTIFCPGRY